MAAYNKTRSGQLLLTVKATGNVLGSGSYGSILEVSVDSF